MERIYKAFNGAGVTSAQLPGVTTGTAIKTMLQLATPATSGLWIVAWGIVTDGHASATKIEAELLSCATGGATVTAFGAGDITLLNRPSDEASQVVTSSTTNSGFTSSNEQTLSAVDIFDTAYLLPTQADRYVMQWPLGREPHVAISRWVRLRVTVAGNAVNAKCWIEWGE